MFKRRRSEDEPTEGQLDAVVADEDLDDDEELDEDVQTDDGATTSEARRTDGPFDVSEIDDDDKTERIDLGALRIAPADGVEVRLEIDEQSGTVQAVTLLAGETAMQLGAFAAPRTEGIWQEVRDEIAASITNSGGTVDHVDGDFGPELRANVTGQDDQGRKGTQTLRFLGVDGPRWFVRGLVSGPGVSDPVALAPLTETFRSIVVVRGDDPKAPHEALPIHLPREAVEDDPNPEAAGHELNPFRRGPEITEIR